MKLNITDSDSKKAMLTIANGRKVTIKLNRQWDDETKEVITKRLTAVAEDVCKRNLGYVMKGQYSPDHPHVIQLKSNNKTSPKVMNVNVTELMRSNAA